MQHGFWSNGLPGKFIFGRCGEACCSPSGLRGPQPRRAEARNSFYVRLRPPQAATRKHFVNSRASALPAVEAISDDGRPQRRSVKNRKSFDCFKSAEGIRFSAGAAAGPEIVSPRLFFAPPFDVKRWHNRLRCQSSLPFGGMTDYLVYKTGVTPATRRVAQFTAAPLRRTAVALRPPSANSTPKAENAVCASHSRRR